MSDYSPPRLNADDVRAGRRLSMLEEDEFVSWHGTLAEIRALPQTALSTPDTL